MKVLLTYANRKYRHNQLLNRQSAEHHCSFDLIWMRGPRDLSSEFIHKHKALLQHSKGGGYWIWKPYIILQALRQLKAGDELFYCDSGARFIGDATVLFDLFDQSRQDIIISCTVHPERVYTKRDAFVLMECDRPDWVEQPQRIASFIAIRNSEWSRSFCEEWLNYCCDERIVTDEPNIMGKDNYEGFKESKGDQSVLSLLSKREGLEVFRDPSQWGNGMKEKYQNSPYEQLIDQTWLIPDKRLWPRVVNKVFSVAENRFGLPKR